MLAIELNLAQGGCPVKVALRTYPVRGVGTVPCGLLLKRTRDYPKNKLDAQSVTLIVSYKH